MSKKTVYSSKVEAAYKKDNILASGSLSRNSLYYPPIFALTTLLSAYMSITSGDGFWFAFAIGSGVFFLLSLLIASISISARRNQKKNTENIKKGLVRSIDGGFYKKCVEAGCTDLTKRSTVEKIYNIAKAEGYTESKEQIIEIYKRAAESLKEMANEQENADKQAKLQQAIENEIRIEEENKKYINFKGISKPSAMIDSDIAILKQRIASADAKIRSVNNGAQAYYHLNKQHEANWATHGGIASALGGPMAGASVAADVAQRSAAAKAHNQNLSNTANTMASVLNSKNYNSVIDAEESIKKLNKKKKDLQLLLVEELPEDKLLKYISPEVLSQEIGKSGAITMKITTKKSPDFLIYDDVPAVVDGSVKVLLMNNNDIAGEAFFSLPISGSSEQTTITVVCREVKSEVKEVKFEPYHLWAIEKMDKIK